MKTNRLTIAAILTCVACAAAGTTDLDVTRVALFSSGVGYFECETSVTGNATAQLKFRTNQINDIIKSMIVQDFDGGTIGAIGYASRDPIEKTLRSFGVDLTEGPSLAELLYQLRGEPVEITGPTHATGIIVDVEEHMTFDDDGNTFSEELLTILTESGLQRIKLDAIQSLRLVNERIDSELRQALATLASGHDADKKTVTLNFDGQGQRHVRVSYLLEAPIWKTSYRLVLDEDKKPYMQGWATVENATEEDWNNISLSLVSGRPISFRMDLYTPLYVPRPLEQLELYASLRPPDYEGGFAGAIRENRQSSRRGVSRKPMMDSSRNELLAVPSAAKAGEAATLYAMIEKETIDLDDTGVASVATAQDAGELFEYRIDTPVSIPRQHSAMLPIVNGTLEGTKLSIFNPATHPKHPLNGLEIKNTTGLHLMQGPITVFDGNIYAGDAKLPDLKPDETRLIAYALDLSTEVLIKHKPQPDELVSLRIAKGTLWHRHKYVDRREYQIKNKIDRPRTVLLEQGYSDIWKLVEPEKAYERTANLLRFKVEVPAGETVSQTVTLERISDESLALTNAGLEQIRFYLRGTTISPAVVKALEQVIAQRTELDKIRRQRQRLEQQRSEDIKEQARVRENLRTLDRSTDAYQRQLALFDQIDARIADYREQIAAARNREEQQRQSLDEYLLSLNVE